MFEFIWVIVDDIQSFTFGWTWNKRIQIKILIIFLENCWFCIFKLQEFHLINNKCKSKEPRQKEVNENEYLIHDTTAKHCDFVNFQLFLFNTENELWCKLRKSYENLQNHHISSICVLRGKRKYTFESMAVIHLIN